MIDKYTALASYLRKRDAEPFVWGRNDCCTFAADWVRLLTGCDHLAIFRVLYSDEIGAGELLTEVGGVARGAMEMLGIPLPTVATAQRGDVVLFESGQGPALGICVGDKFAALKPPIGIGYFAMRHAVTAWRVA